MRVNMQATITIDAPSWRQRVAMEPGNFIDYRQYQVNQPSLKHDIRSKVVFTNEYRSVPCTIQPLSCLNQQTIINMSGITPIVVE